MGYAQKKHYDGGGHTQKLGEVINALQRDLVRLGGVKAINFANGIPSAVASADASDEATLYTLINEMKADFNDDVKLANEQKDAASLIPIAIAAADGSLCNLPDADTEARAVALANDLKAKYNVLYLLANELKADYNTEGSITVSAADTVVEATADATDQASAITLANALKIKQNALITLIAEVRSDIVALAGPTFESFALFQD